jgi:hypothetical protein
MKFKSAHTLVNLTTAQRDSISTPTAGMKVFNITTSREEVYDGSSWVSNEPLPQWFANGMFMFINGSVPSSSKVALQIMDIETTLPVGIPNSKAYAYTAPTAQTDFNIIREANGSYGTQETIGTISFPTSSNGSFTFNTQVVLGVGDMLYVESPANTNAMADMFINIRGKSLINSY